jgi:lipopolysaccharide export system protein LptA
MGLFIGAFAIIFFYYLPLVWGLELSSNQPIEIESTQGIECHHKTRACVARGNAVARQGHFLIFGHTLIAQFKKGGAGQQKLWMIKAKKNIKIYSQPSQEAFATFAEYSINKNLLTLAGHAKIYESVKNRTIQADRIIAYLKRENGKNKIEKISADGHVTLRTPTEVVSGSEGTYLSHRDFIIIKGDVKITRDEGQLNGTYAEVDLDTGISKMLSNSSTEVSKKAHVKALLPPPCKTTSTENEAT